MYIEAMEKPASKNGQTDKPNGGQLSARAALMIYCYKNRTTPQEVFAKRRKERVKSKETVKGKETAPVTTEFKGFAVLTGSDFYV